MEIFDALVEAYKEKIKEHLKETRADLTGFVDEFAAKIAQDGARYSVAMAQGDDNAKESMKDLVVQSKMLAATILQHEANKAATTLTDMLLVFSDAMIRIVRRLLIA